MEKIRCNKRSIWINTIKGFSAWVLFFAVLFVNLIFDDENIDDLIEVFAGRILLSIVVALVATVVLLGVLYLFNYIHWKKTWIWIEDGTLVEERNLILRKKKSVKLSAVSTVNLQQNLIERILKLYHLKLDFQSSATADSTDFDLIFDESMAKKWKAMILRQEYVETPRVHLGETEDIALDTEIETGGILSEMDQREEGRISFGLFEVLRHCVLSLSFSQILLLIVSAFFLTADVIISGSIGALWFIVVVALWSAIKQFFNYYGYTFSKNGELYHLEYGLFTKRSFDLDATKSSAMIIHQPFLARICGYAYGELVQVGLGGSEEEQGEKGVFSLCVKKDELMKLVQEMIPDYRMDIAGERMSKKEFFLIRPLYLIVVAVCFGFVGALSEWNIPFVILAIVLICFYGKFLKFLEYKTERVVNQENYLTIIKGRFAKETHIIRYDKVQSMAITQDLITKKLGIATSNVTILASMGKDTVSTTCINRQYLDRIKNAMIAHENRLILGLEKED